MISVPNAPDRPGFGKAVPGQSKFSDLASCDPAGLFKPEPGRAGPCYRPYRLFPGCLVGQPCLYSLAGLHRFGQPTHHEWLLCANRKIHGKCFPITEYD